MANQTYKYIALFHYTISAIADEPDKHCQSFSVWTYRHPSFDKLKKGAVTSHRVSKLKNINSFRAGSGMSMVMVLISKR